MNWLDKANDAVMAEIRKEEDEKVFRILDWIAELQEQGIFLVAEEEEVWDGKPK